MPEKISHEDLRKLAISWLKSRTWPSRVGGNPRGGLCSIVASEVVTSANDIPDAIGWNSRGRSVLIECKTTKRDFYQDGNKPQRQNGSGLGNQRYFLVPIGLISKDEIPEGWGLLECDGKRVECTVKAPTRELSASDQSNEKLILMSLIRRINKREFLIIQPEEMEEILEPNE